MSFEKKRLILADDHEIFLDSLSTLIGSEKNIEIVAKVGNGKQLLEAVQTQLPDLCIVDMDMPEMNGLELVKKVRADDRFTDLPIIMVTTEGGKAEVITALKAGVNNYIVKPFTPQVLKEKLAAVMGIEG